MRKTIIVIASVIALFTAACRGKRGAASEATPVVKSAKVETVKLTALDYHYEAVGTVRSKTTSVVSSKIVGVITALHVREGDRVRQGQVIVEIDHREAGAQRQKAQAAGREAQDALEEVERTIRAAESGLAAAEANKTLAASTLKRYQALRERRSVSPQEFDEVKARSQVAAAEAERADRLLGSLQARRDQALARIEQAKAEIASAEIYAGYARIASPINGVVTARPAEVGALAAPGTPLITIEDDAHYWLEVAVEESKVGNIRLKMPARVRIAAAGQDEFEGAVTEIVPVADPASRSYTVKVELMLPGAAGQILRSGLFGQARFAVGQRQAIAIPNKAIIERGGLASVYVVDDADIAHLRLVTTGGPDGDRTEILSGLNDGERVVTEGAEGVSERSRLK